MTASCAVWRSWRADMSLDEQIALLASNGMLVKRPIFITNGKICVGFKADEWKAAHRS